MRKSKGKKAIEQVALKSGINVAEARREIELAIDAAIANPDPTVQAFWDKYIKGDRKPTPEEFIVYMADKIKKEEKL